jgi:uncharacterized membrane protein YeaQ/YmgE (transglycosylase-associated protein family)
MSILAWVALGFIAGWLAQFVTKESPGGGGLTGIVLTIAVGIIGAAVGGFIGTALDWGTVDDFDPRSLALAFLGAVVVLLVLGAFKGGGSRRR